MYWYGLLYTVGTYGNTNTYKLTVYKILPRYFMVRVNFSKTG